MTCWHSEFRCFPDYSLLLKTGPTPCVSSLSSQITEDSDVIVAIIIIIGVDYDPLHDAAHLVILLMYKACSKKDRTFAIKTLFYNILSTVPIKVVPTTGDIPFPTSLPLLDCFLERTFCDGAQFSYRIFLNLRVFKKRPNFLNSSPTCIEGALRLLSATSGRFWQQTAICPVSLLALFVELHPLNWARAQAVRRIKPTNSLCTCPVQRM
jgi:hypothetical protein